MSYARQMLGTYACGIELGADPDVLARVIDAAGDCAQACEADTDADLSESNVNDMVACIRLCQDCAALCTTTAAVLSRAATMDGRVVRPLLEACVAICQSCGGECEHHAQWHGHCRVCAEACRRCEQACAELLKVIR
jgi:hypothetical protein